MPPSGFEYVAGWRAQHQETGWWHSFEMPDGSVMEGVNSVASLRLRLSQFPIPDDLRGKCVLDIGCWDGWFSFEMERRGAEVGPSTTGTIRASARSMRPIGRVWTIASSTCTS